MADPYVREVGRVEDMDSRVIVLGVDYDTVTLTAPGWAAGGVRLTQAQAEEFAPALRQRVLAGRAAGTPARGGDPRGRWRRHDGGA